MASLKIHIQNSYFILPTQHQSRFSLDLDSPTDRSKREVHGRQALQSLTYPDRSFNSFF